MKKSEIVKQLDIKATSIFMAASIALTVGGVLSHILNSIKDASVIGTVINIVSFLFIIVAYVFTIKGFVVLDKACRHSEQNENYYMGKNLKLMAILSLILSVILQIVSFVFYLFLQSYAKAPSLTPSDLKAAANVKIITAIVLIISQLVSISMVYIVYLWKLHTITSKKDSLNNFALLTMFILIIQLAIAILNSAYTIMGKQSTFLSDFSSVLMVIKYVVLTLFFVARKYTGFKEIKE